MKLRNIIRDVTIGIGATVFLLGFGAFVGSAIRAQAQTFGARVSPGLNIFGLPYGASMVTNSATGTTAATTATLAAVTGQNTYLCWFSIRANATVAATADSTVTGTIGGTMHFTQWTAPLASGVGLTEMIFTPCIQSSAANTAIAVISAAPGSGGVVSVSAGGYQY